MPSNYLYGLQFQINNNNLHLLLWILLSGDIAINPGPGSKYFRCLSFNAQSIRSTTKLPDGTQRRLDSRPQSIMGIERLIPRVTSLTVDCQGVNMSLTKPIWKLSNDKSVRLRYFVKRNSMLLLYCCDHHYNLCFTISSLPFLNCMGRSVILAL